MTRREADDFHREVVEYSTNLFYVHDPEHKLLYVSPQSRAFFDCEPEEALVRWTEFLTDHPGNPRGIAATERALATGERQPVYELELVGTKGRRVWVEVNEAPVVRDGRVVAIVGALTDITERKRADEERARSSVTRRVVRRILQHLVRGPQTNLQRREIGHAIAGENPRADLHAYLDDFRTMGIGELQLVSDEGGLCVVEGRSLLEVTPGFPQPTCHIPLGYLEKAIGTLAGAPALGTETHCQSRGNEACRFVVRVKRP